MHPLRSLAACALLVSCGSDPAPATENAAALADTTASARMVADWPGYYEGTFPLGEDRRMTVQLWVRSDSTFVIRQRRGEADTLPEGAIGRWQAVDLPGGPATGLLRFQHGGNPPDHYQRTETGLAFMDVINGVGASAGMALEKLADEIGDEIPRMRLRGEFTYMADAMSFRPCGSPFSWPCAGGEEWTDEGEVLGSLNTAELERRYLRSVKQGGDPWLIEVECSLAMGPAMEGDGADEYIFIHRVLGSAEACP
ncbi:MAG: hypothetical protein QY325_04755 [Flavobacteriales bacterium]|nr:MAG: hypothetical protein QY325_04755 [Flavobacteriales bacterium]